MVVVMTAEAGETEVDGVVDRVRSAGGDAFVSRGMSRTIVGLVGDVDHLDTLNLRGMPGVSDVVRISDRKSTRLNSSHRCISYAVFCLKKKKRDLTKLRDAPPDRHIGRQPGRA